MKPLKDKRGNYVKDDLKRIVKEETAVFVKDIFIPHNFLIDGLSSYGKALTRKNEIAKKRSVVFDRYSARYYTVAHSKDEIEKALQDVSKRPQIGFLGHLRKSK